MKSCRLFVLPLLAAVLSGCSSDRAKVSICGASPDESIVLMQMDVNRYKVLDTLVCDARGQSSFRVDVPEDDPDFYFLYSGGRKIGTLLLRAGDDVRVELKDGQMILSEGSSDCELLNRMERRYNEVTGQFERLSDALVANVDNPQKSDELRREMGSLFVSYYRESVGFVMQHPSSLVSVYCLSLTIGDNLKVFSSDTDVAHFRTVRDSLGAHLPHSRYLESLERQIRLREDALAMRIKLDSAKEIGFPDLVLSDTQGQKRQLSSVDSKVIVLHFWSAADAAQKMYNMEVLKPLYEKYSAKGMQIWQVSFDTDKTLWATVVREQGLQWTNVNDYDGDSALYYSVTELPATFVIADGSIVARDVYGMSNLDKLISQYLK